VRRVGESGVPLGLGLVGESRVHKRLTLYLSSLPECNRASPTRTLYIRLMEELPCSLRSVIEHPALLDKPSAPPPPRPLHGPAPDLCPLNGRGGQPRGAPQQASDIPP
jgi:hypothetical protein